MIVLGLILRFYNNPIVGGYIGYFISNSPNMLVITVATPQRSLVDMYRFLLKTKKQITFLINFGKIKSTNSRYN